MSTVSRTAQAALLASALTAPAAHAGRPMMVDDAAIVGARNCQLESWVQNNPDSREYWAVPACNLGGNLEVAFGGARIDGPQGPHGAGVLQGKTLFKPLERNGWGAGLVFGDQFSGETGVVGDLYISAPVSFSFHDDRFLVHANLGWLREKIAARSVATWGVGAETKLSDRTTLTTETFGQQHGKPFVQLGLKHWLVVDRVQLDATYDNRVGGRGAERFVSLGAVLFTAN